MTTIQRSKTPTNTNKTNPTTQHTILLVPTKQISHLVKTPFFITHLQTTSQHNKASSKLEGGGAKKIKNQNKSCRYNTHITLTSSWHQNRHPYDTDRRPQSLTNINNFINQNTITKPTNLQLQ